MTADPVEQVKSAMAQGDVQRALSVAAALPPPRSESHPSVVGLGIAVDAGMPAVADAFIGLHPQVSSWMVGRALVAALDAQQLDYAVQLVGRRPPIVPMGALLLSCATHGRADLITKLGELHPEEVEGLSLVKPMAAAARRCDSDCVDALIEVNGPGSVAMNARVALGIAVQHRCVLRRVVAYDGGDGRVVLPFLRGVAEGGRISSDDVRAILEAWRPGEDALSRLRDPLASPASLASEVIDALDQHQSAADFSEFGDADVSPP